MKEGWIRTLPAFALQAGGFNSRAERPAPLKQRSNECDLHVLHEHRVMVSTAPAILPNQGPRSTARCNAVVTAAP